jgi:replicative DNA helicase
MNAHFPSSSPLPVNIEAEQEILGTLIARPETLTAVLPILSDEHFGEPLHATLYRAVCAAVEAQQTPSLAIMRQHLGTRNIETDLGGVSLGKYLARLVANAPPPVGLAATAGIVRDLWAIRQIAAVAGDIARDRVEGFDPTAYLSAKFAQLDEIRAALSDRERTSATAGQAGQEVVQWIESHLQGQAETLPSTGLRSLDGEIGGGLHPASLIVIAARTSMGKSILGTEIADALSREDRGTVYHSLEMPRRQVAARQISSRLQRRGYRIPYGSIIKGDVSVELAEQVAAVSHDMHGEPHWIEDAGGVTIGQIAATSERRMNAFVRKGIKLGAVIIDHAHKVASSRNDRNGEAEVREVSAGALALAKRLEVPVILLAQCNRQTEGRDDKRPGPADLRGSGALEEDADVLIFPYRPAYYLERSPEFRRGDPDAIARHVVVRHQLEIIIDKNRAGRSNVILDAWIDPALNAYANGGGHERPRRVCPRPRLVRSSDFPS